MWLSVEHVDSICHKALRCAVIFYGIFHLLLLLSLWYLLFIMERYFCTVVNANGEGFRELSNKTSVLVFVRLQYQTLSILIFYIYLGNQSFTKPVLILKLPSLFSCLENSRYPVVIRLHSLKFGGNFVSSRPETLPGFEESVKFFVISILKSKILERRKV